jgi:phosphatidylglycerol:prolipoprotein diacylglycerol transferase
MLAAIAYDPIVHVPIGPLRISPHGVGIAVGFLIGASLMLPESRRKGIPDEDVYMLLTRAAIGAIIGARIAYVANHFSEYDSVIEILKVWEGGISLLGGIFGAILLAMPKARSMGHSVWKLLDAAAPGLALGIVVGRVGDLVVADHLGKTTDFFLGYRCPAAETASPCPVGEVVHQTALYDMILTAGLLALLLILRRRSRSSPPYDGFFIFVFGLWYGIGRLVEDFLREDLRRFGLTGSQITAVVTATACVFMLFLLKRTPRWGRWDAGRTGAPDDTPTMAARRDGEE